MQKNRNDTAPYRRLVLGCPGCLLVPVQRGETPRGEEIDDNAIVRVGTDARPRALGLGGPVGRNRKWRADVGRGGRRL
jgi:hypothetical protein